MSVFVFVVLLVAVSVNGQSIQRFDKNITVSNGNDIELHCITTGASDRYMVGWTMVQGGETHTYTISTGTTLVTFGNDPSIPGSRDRYDLRVVGGTYSIAIQDANMRDEGRWQCALANTEAKESVWLTVKTLPTITEVSEHFTGSRQPLENSTITLVCKANGSPKPSIVWSKPRDKLPNGDYLYHGSVLELVNITSKARGAYQCSASNTEGSIKETVVVAMNHKPVVTVAKEAVYVWPDEPAQLICNFDANPTVSDAKWIKVNTGRQVNTDDKEDIKVESSNKMLKLTFAEVKTEDFAEYRCEIRNTQGITKKTIRLERGEGDALAESGQSISGSATFAASLIVMVTALFTAVRL